MRASYRVTPLYRWHQRHGAHMASVDEWRSVVSYGDPKAEWEASRSGIGICDVSSIAKIDVQGKQSRELLARISDIGVPQVGRWIRMRTSEREPVAAHLVRLTKERFLVLADSRHRLALCSSLEVSSVGLGCAHVNDLTSTYAAMLLIGPQVLDLLKKLSAADVGGIPADGCVQTSLARVWTLLARWSAGEIPQWLLLVSRDYAEYAWECILSAGAELGILPVGTEVQQALPGREAD